MALISFQFIQSSYMRWHRALGISVSAVDVLAESRGHKTAARLQLIESAGADGQPQPAAIGHALAELAAAGQVMDDWVDGRSAILGLAASAPQDVEVRRRISAYRAELDTISELLRGRSDMIDIRTHFSAATRTADDLSAVLYDQLRAEIENERRRYLLGIAVWLVLLVGTAVLGTIGVRARIRAEHERGQTEIRLAGLRLKAPVGLVECDPAGRVVAANRWWTQATGMTENQWRSREWWHALTPSSRATAEASWRASVGAGIGGSSDYDIAAAAGRPVMPAYTVWSTARAADGDTGWILTFTDMAGHRHAEEQLRQAQKMELIGQLAGGIAHDFNNLLTVIGANAQMLRDADLDGEDVGMVEDIIAATESGAAMVGSLMQFSRRAPLEVCEVDLREFVTEQYGMIGSMLRSGINFEVVADPDTPIVRAAPRALQQILLNLAANARDAMPDGGTFTLRAQPLNGGGALVASDSGAGMDDRTLQQLFEPFFTTKPPGRGTGLGLATVRQLVERQNGSISVESAPGAGTTFTIVLQAVRA